MVRTRTHCPSPGPGPGPSPSPSPSPSPGPSPEPSPSPPSPTPTPSPDPTQAFIYLDEKGEGWLPLVDFENALLLVLSPETDDTEQQAKQVMMAPQVSRQ